MYSILRNILFLLEAEKAHYFSMNLLRFACGISPLKWMIKKYYSAESKSLKKELWGLSFKNPVGLAAGFDKNASYLRELETLGFGFIEIGTVTPLPQKGNEKPRLFRLPQDKALINRMGFNNDGVKIIKSRLEKWKGKNENIPDGKRMIIGGNIGKNKNTPNEEAWKDYEICFEELFDVVDYFVVNVSSPNTPGLRALQDKDALTNILSRLQAINDKKEKRKPLLLKIAPDLTPEQLEDIATIAADVKLDGIVASNTTISREGLNNQSNSLSDEIGAGGLSGAPLKNKSDDVLATLVKLTANKIPIIGSGGIFTGDDAIDKIKIGASLVQVWTGFIYEGPGIVKNICKKIIE
jgi:dihydroorotate dehydrogenase